MPSTSILKLGAAVLLGLGALNLVWLDLSLGPRVFSSEAPAQVGSGELPRDPVARVDVRSVDPAKGSAPTDDPAMGSASPTVTTKAADKKAVSHVPRTTIYFDSMSSRVGSSTRTKLAEVAKRAGARGIVHLEGHADYRGDVAYNEQLSKRRVDNVGAELIKQGFDAARIVSAHVGERGADEVVETELWRDRNVDVWIEGGPE